MTLNDIEDIDVFFNIKKEGEVFGHRVCLTDTIKSSILALINNSHIVATKVNVVGEPTYKKGTRH